MASTVEKCGRGWFHSECQNITEDTYKLLNQKKIHFFCSSCDEAVGKILKALVEVTVRQDKLAQNVIEIRKDIAIDIKKVRVEIDEVKKCVNQAKWQEDTNKIRTEVNYELTKVNNDLTKIKESLATVSGMREIGNVRNNGEELNKTGICRE